MKRAVTRVIAQVGDRKIIGEFVANVPDPNTRTVKIELKNAVITDGYYWETDDDLVIETAMENVMFYSVMVEEEEGGETDGT